MGKNALHSLTEDRNTNKYKKKQMIYSEGNHPNRLYYVLKGKVKAYKTNEDGKELVTDLFSRGDFLGYVPCWKALSIKIRLKPWRKPSWPLFPKKILMN